MNATVIKDAVFVIKRELRFQFRNDTLWAAIAEIEKELSTPEARLQEAEYWEGRSSPTKAAIKRRRKQKRDHMRKARAK